MRLIFNIEHKSEIMAMSLREVWPPVISVATQTGIVHYSKLTEKSKSYDYAVRN
jgi:L-rhamnose mutarotase